MSNLPTAGKTWPQYKYYTEEEFALLSPEEQALGERVPERAVFHMSWSPEKAQ